MALYKSRIIVMTTQFRYKQGTLQKEFFITAWLALARRDRNGHWAISTASWSGCHSNSPIQPFAAHSHS